MKGKEAGQGKLAQVDGRVWLKALSQEMEYYLQKDYE